MTRTLPADFRQLRTMVEDRHQEVARRAMADGPPKAELVEEYLRENDLLSRTSQGAAYLGFSQLLSSRQHEQIRADIDQILAQDFAREHMTAVQREELARTSVSGTLRAVDLWDAAATARLFNTGFVRGGDTEAVSDLGVANEATSPDPVHHRPGRSGGRPPGLERVRRDGRVGADQRLRADRRRCHLRRRPRDR
ncbi:DUF3375 family protein [Spirillospora sp. NPDC047279]|uniref:DUF3375 family protein n=1 Tax=Spirillospora sp. NPDC047279 TaxID=3155478 RepID=UPI0033F860DB